MNLDDISVVVPPSNEAPNLARTLSRVAWAPTVILVDSHSTDGTPRIAGEFPNTQLVQRDYVDMSTKWTQGCSLASTDWVLALDADFVLQEGFDDELRRLQPAPEIDAYHARFAYCINGRRLRGTLYPPRAVLFRRRSCHFIQDGHTQLLVVPGATAMLKTEIDHDDRKPLTRWFSSQDHCAKQEAEKLEAHTGPLRMQDWLRKKIIIAPAATAAYCLVFKGLAFDGWPGLFYTSQRVLAELMLSLRLLERKISPPTLEDDDER
jgi:glycosyltransferase involved in cell wall biosynthesis